MSYWLTVLEAWAAGVPALLWPALLGALFLATLITLPLARRQARKAGARTAGKPDTTDATGNADSRRDRALLIAALAPAALFWVAVAAGSARGLIAFGRDNLRWRDGWECLVPLTLDGIGISFGVLAFRAVRKHRAPDRSVRVAWGSMTASALINYAHETGLVHGSALGGAYLALLSILSMLIFHELLDQFEQGADWIKRDNPKFGLRWLTWPTNTACAWVAWRNYPPTEGTKATVGNAVVHLSTVRAAKQSRRAEQFVADPWWTPLAPWLRVKQLAAVLSEQQTRASVEQAERAELAARLDAVAADFAAAEQRQAEHAEKLAEQLAAAQAERVAQQQARESAEQVAAEAEHRAATLAEQVAKLRAEQRGAGKTGRGTKDKTAPERPAEEAQPRAGSPLMTDDEAVAAMLAAHPEQSYTWAPREVHRVTRAGFGRIPKLVALVAEHHARSGSEQSSGAADDDAEERAS